MHLILREMEQTEIHAAVQRGDLDLAITFDYAHAPMAAPPSVRTEHLMDDPIMAVVASNHALAQQEMVDPSDVDASEWITTNVDVAGLAAADPSGRPPALDFEGQDFRTVLNLVAAGLGVALLPSLALHHAPTGAVVRPLAGTPLMRRLHTARLDTSRVPVPVRRLEAHLRDVAADLAQSMTRHNSTG